MARPTIPKEEHKSATVTIRLNQKTIAAFKNKFPRPAQAMRRVLEENNADELGVDGALKVSPHHELKLTSNNGSVIHFDNAGICYIYESKKAFAEGQPMFQFRHKA
jgi:hypothetical protein